MAKEVKRVVTQRVAAKKKSSAVWNFPLESLNLKIIGGGIALIVIGYLLMLTGMGEDYSTVGGKWMNPFAVNVAPVVLVIGYCIVIPYGIYTYFSNSNTESKEDAEKN